MLWRVRFAVLHLMLCMEEAVSTSGLVGAFSEGDARGIIEVIERINETTVA